MVLDVWGDKVADIRDTAVCGVWRKLGKSVENSGGKRAGGDDRKRSSA